MEFIDYTMKKATAASTYIKLVHSKQGLNLNLKPGKNERTFSGIGIYLEVDVLKKGSSSKVRIPFFNAYDNDKFVNINGYNFVNPLAEKIITEVVENKNPKFDLLTFQTVKTAELDARIGSLGTSPEDLAEKARLEHIRDDIIALAVKRDSQNLAKFEIERLEEIIKKGLNLSVYPNETARKTAIETYYNQFVQLVTLRHQLKNMTWSQKKGLSKFNNKIFRRISAGVVAGGLAIGSVTLRFPEIFKNVADWFKGNGSSAIQTMQQGSQNGLTKEAELAEQITREDIGQSAIITSNKISINSEKINEAYANNLNTYSGLRAIFAKYQSVYNFSFNDAIAGYTFVEHAHELEPTGLNRNIVENYIIKTRTFLSLAMSQNIQESLTLIPLQEETLSFLNSNNLENIVSFVSNAYNNNTPLLDVLTVGQLLQNELSGTDLKYFDEIYKNEIEKYCSAILEGKLEPIKTAKVMRLQRI